jgi:Aldo/keto reductase family
MAADQGGAARAVGDIGSHWIAPPAIRIVRPGIHDADVAVAVDTAPQRRRSWRVSKPTARRSVSSNAMPEVPTVRLAYGAEMPVLRFGTWPLDEDDAERVVRAALDVGYRLIDTAEEYATNRASVRDPDERR